MFIKIEGMRTRLIEAALSKYCLILGKCEMEKETLIGCK